MKSGILGFLVLSMLVVVPISANAQNVDGAEIEVTSHINSPTLRVGEQRLIKWETKNFPTDARVNVNLIKKVSDSPLQYSLVRQIAVSTPNDGKEMWKVLESDIGENLLIEVTCAGSVQFPNGCSADTAEGQFAVKDSFARNLANILSAFLKILSR